MEATEGRGLVAVANQTNPQKQKTDISKAITKLTTDFENSWKLLGADKDFTESIKFDLRFVNQSTLQVSIDEQIKGTTSPKNLSLLARSDGFQWYYCFIMQLLYNPDNNKRILFLLDEPGLYLNPAAQVSLLKNFKDKVAKDKETQIIYSTHSHYMLNPESISPHQIHIVKKEKDKLIRLYSLKNYPHSGSRYSEIAPLFEALQIPFNEQIIGDKNVILVEGIHDFYALSLFGNLGSNFYIYPCRGATTIMHHIPFFIMQGIKYAYLVDNDKEGVDKAMGEIEKHYELDKGIVLPFDGYLQDNGKAFEMDNVFSDVLSEWNTKLGLNSSASYNSMITALYHCSNVKIQRELLAVKEIKDKFGIIKNKLLEKFQDNIGGLREHFDSSVGQKNKKKIAQ